MCHSVAHLAEAVLDCLEATEGLVEVELLRKMSAFLERLPLVLLLLAVSGSS